MTTSLRIRSFLLVLAALALGGALAQQAGRVESRRTADEDIDRRLERAAWAILSSWQGPPTRARSITVQTAPGGIELPDFEIRTTDRRVLMQSRDFPAIDQARRGADLQSGFSTYRIGDTDWRVLTVVDPRRELICRSATTLDVRDARQATLGARFDRPLLIGLPLVALLAWIAITLGLRPLRALARELEARTPDDLGPIRSLPGRSASEIRGLVRTLDSLFGRLRETFDAQRIFTAAAGHELRTPLAGLRMQIDVARRARDAEQHTHALARIAESGERMETLVDRLLRLARLNSAPTRITGPQIDLAAILQRYTADTADLELTLTIQAASIAGDADLLCVLLDNLVDNARRHGALQRPVTIALDAAPGHWILGVCDDGPGIEHAERERVLDPFYRGNDRGDDAGRGSGLGLALVRAIARAHGGEATIESPDSGGTCVRIHLPRADASTAPPHA